MSRFFKRKTNQDDAAIAEANHINVSDSVPILNRSQFDLSGSTNNVHHDLRRNADADGILYFFIE